MASGSGLGASAQGAVTHRALATGRLPSATDPLTRVDADPTYREALARSGRLWSCIRHRPASTVPGFADSATSARHTITKRGALGLTRLRFGVFRGGHHGRSPQRR